MGAGVEPALVVCKVGVCTEREQQVGCGQRRPGVLGPLDHHHRAAVEGFFKACISPRVRFREPIKIKMMKIKLREIIRFDQRKSGARNTTLISERPQQLSHQRGFSGSQIAAQIKAKPWRDAGCQHPGQLPRCLDAAEDAHLVGTDEIRVGLRGLGGHVGLGSLKGYSGRAQECTRGS